MKSNRYCVFVCNKQSTGDEDGCCGSLGTAGVDRAFQAQVAAQQLTGIEVRQSGCLNHCSSGAVALVYQTDWGDFPWLPTKVRLKIRRRFFPDRYLYGHLTSADIPDIVESHFVKGKPVKRCQISNPSASIRDRQ
jgi:(2Fe-2S) ferredoxin